MAEFGVQVMADQRIVVDDNIITSFCPETAADVGFALLARLVGEEKPVWSGKPWGIRAEI